MDASINATVTASPVQVSVELSEEDIPGAALDEPLDVHNVAALRWWLQCHGIKPASSWKKQHLISRLELNQTSSVSAILTCTD